MPNPDQRAPYLMDGPVALIIGCGDLGMGCARVLGRNAPLFIADISAEKLMQSIAVLEHEGYKACGLECDITDRGQVDKLAKRLSEKSGVRVLAHVAAIGDSPEGWRILMDVDLLGAHNIARAVMPHMVRGGVAIFISSTGSYRCPPSARLEALLDDPFQPDFHDKLAEAYGRQPTTLEAYFMAKQGVNRLARNLAIEWGAKDVRALSLSPGVINSSMHRTAISIKTPLQGKDDAKPEPEYDISKIHNVLGRQGTLLEITSVVAFLASDAASFVTGIDIPVDGGSTANWRSQGVIQR